MNESEFIKVEDTDIKQNILVLKEQSPFQANDLTTRRSSLAELNMLNQDSSKASTRKQISESVASFQDSLENSFQENNNSLTESFPSFNFN